MSDDLQIFELINPSDHITFVASVSHAEVMATIFKESFLFVRNANGDTVDGLENAEFQSRHDAIYGSSETLIEYAKCFESALCATASDRETINDALSRMPDPADRQDFIDKFQDRNRSSLNDICGRLHNAADKMKSLASTLT